MSLQTSQFGSLGRSEKKAVPAKWLACVWFLGLFFAINGRSVGSSFGAHPQHHQVFSLLAQLQAVPPRHCVSRGFNREAFFGKEKAAPYVTSLPVPGHLGHAIGRPTHGMDPPGLGHRIEELLATGPDDQAHGICNRSPDAFNGYSPLSIHKSGQFLRIVSPEGTAGESSTNIFVTKTSKS